MVAGRSSSVNSTPAFVGSNPTPLASAGGVAKRPKAPVSNTNGDQHIRQPNNFIDGPKQSVIAGPAQGRLLLPRGKGRFKSSDPQPPPRAPTRPSYNFIAMGRRGLLTFATLKVPHAGGNQSDLAVELSARLIPHPASTTQYCGGSTTLGYLVGSTPITCSGTWPYTDRAPLFGGFSPERHPISATHRPTHGSKRRRFSPFHGFQPDFGIHIRETPVEWAVPDGAGHSL